MNEETITSPTTTDVESRLCDALRQGDAALSDMAPVLRHLLSNDDSILFGDAIVARTRGMTDDVSRQLMVVLEGAEADQSFLTAALIDNPAFLGHVHALVLEWHLTELLQVRVALDTVLSPLLQALIGSVDEATAALAMKFLASQARFGQAQRRMRLPLNELPGDLLHFALVTMRAVAGASPEADARAATAEAVIRAEYNEGYSRLGLISRLVSGMGAGVVAALSLQHAGAAIFLSALAQTSSLGRNVATLATCEPQRTRLALALCAAGLKPSSIEEQLLVLDPDAELPEGLDRLNADRAAALLVLGAA